MTPDPRDEGRDGPASVDDVEGPPPAEADAEIDDATRTVRLRRRAEAPPIELDEDDPDDGSTVVVRRESRRRAAAAAAAADEEVDPATVLSRSRTRGPEPLVPGTTALPRPSDLDPAVYSPRAGGPVIVPRAPVVPRVPQDPIDTAAIEAERRRRAARRLVVAITLASVVAVVAVIGLVVLLLTM